MFLLHYSHLQPRIMADNAENTAADVPIEVPARPTKKRSPGSTFTPAAGKGDTKIANFSAV